MKHLLLILFMLSGCGTVRFQDKIVDPKNRTVATRNADINQCLGKAYGVNAYGQGGINDQKFWQCIVDKDYNIED